MTILLFIVSVISMTLIVPNNHLNHRLTYKSGPKFINSSVNDNSRINDYFNFPDEFTFLSNNDESLCLVGNNQIEVCKKSNYSMVWKVENIKRHVRIRNANGDCLTLGEYNKPYDTYELIMQECKGDSNDQVFILSQDHGDVLGSEVNQGNANTFDHREKNKIINKGYEFSDKN